MIDTIITAAADLFGVDRAELLSQSRRRPVVWARQAAALVAYDCGRVSHGLGVVAIGEALGGRDHTTISHARAAATERAVQSPAYALLLAELYQAVLVLPV